METNTFMLLTKCFVSFVQWLLYHNIMHIRISDTFNGVKLSDRELDSDTKAVVPRVLDDINIDDDETVVMKMNPNDRLFSKITLEQTEQDIEEGFAKQRWEDRRKIENAKRVENNEVVKDTEVLDRVNKVIKFNKMRATNMKCNQRVQILEPDESDAEVKRNNLRIELMKESNSYMNEHCDKNGTIIDCYMDEQQKNGIKRLRNRVVDGEIVSGLTDKSSKITVMKPETYKFGLSEHTKKDREINKKELNKVNSKLNKHTKSFVKILGVAKEYGDKQFKRAVANVTVHKDGELPVLRGNEKDHKKDQVGIKMRAIVNGMNGPKRALSELVSGVLENTLHTIKPESVVKSTEEMLNSFERYGRNAE